MVIRPEHHKASLRHLGAEYVKIRACCTNSQSSTHRTIYVCCFILILQTTQNVTTDSVLWFCQIRPHRLSSSPCCKWWHTKYVRNVSNTIVVHLHTKLHAPSTNVSLLMAIKPKTKDTSRSTAILALHIRNFNLKNLHFAQNILPHPKYASPACCCYWLQENETFVVRVSFNSIVFIQSFIKLIDLFKSS